MKRSLLLVIAPLVLSTAACGSDSGTAPVSTAPPDITTTTFAPSLGVNIASMTKTPDGLYYSDVVTGSGATAASGNKLTVNYVGSFPTGTTFGSSTADGAPFTFTLGIGAVIPGWDEGLIGIRAGGTRLLVIPPSLGYGTMAYSNIPGNSILVFSVQLQTIQ